MDTIRAVVGLGNPGDAYRLTRHNAGFLVVRSLQKRFIIKKKRTIPGLMQVSQTMINSHELLAVLPLTFMNRSGLAVKDLLDRYHLKPSSVLVVYDDLDLPLGTLRLRRRGGAGSHNGMKSIIETVGTQDIPRLRLGIGSDEPIEDRASFVLSPFTTQEWPRVQAMIDEAVDVILAILQQGLDTVMNEVNTRHTLAKS